MKIIIGCEFSGIIRECFAKLGHDAWSCDLIETEKSGNHIIGNILDILDNNWDLGIFHPPCTYISNAGVRHLSSIPSRNGVLPKIHGKERWKLMYEACDFFLKLKNAPIPRICIENPIPHGYARNIIGKYDQIIQPWQFGHGETKATCLWLKNLPLLKPTNIVDGREHRIHMMGPSKDRAKNRSRSFEGIGIAMATQYGILKDL